ncbi:MAG TPA: transglutaminase domain-containing protein, partial [Rectinemataceae bacterium]|nr:transglutaminase domain-containing protein [Rectinemataceae bacterium]
LSAVSAQFAAHPYVRPFAELLFPMFSDVGNYSQGFSAGALLEYPVLPYLVPFVRGGYSSNPLKTTTSGALDLLEGDVGLGLALKLGDSFGMRLDAMGGAVNASYLNQSGNAYTLGTRLEAGLRVSPAWTVSAMAGMSRYFGSEAAFLTVGSAGLVASFDLSMIAGRSPKLRIEDQKLDPVFPSLYAYYDDHPFGTVTLRNGEDAAIKNVTVSFNAGHYMDQPKVCGHFASIPAGGSVPVQLTALFTDAVLSITQGVDAKGEIIVRYTYIGAPTEARFPIDFRMHHRNAITWVDDRRAAAFVSPTNAASLWFSKYAAGIVRDRMRGDINKNLQYALGLFEAERLYGLNYVVVPANDYSVKHADSSIIDSVQFPHQTLQNRGGDCSDLSILYASLLQSLGIEAAFITIPGHIFAAFDLGISEEQAKTAFYDRGLLIVRDGHVWAPVEITMVKDGFMKAWKVGAKEWSDNVKRGQAAFYPLPDCWKVYPPAAFPDVNPRFMLPDEAETMRSFDSSLDRFVVREIDPQVQDLKTRLASADPNKLANELGILYGRYGMLKEAWAEFSAASKGGYQSAWDNLANVAFLRKDFSLALSYYQYAQKLDAADDLALLGIARCQYELEHYDLSDSAYAELKTRDPGEAGKFGYLASLYDQTGRAWSLSDRFATTAWARPAAPAPIAVAAAAPTATSRPVSEAPAAPVPFTPAAAVPAGPAPAPPTAAEKAAAQEEPAAPPAATPAHEDITAPPVAPEAPGAAAPIAAAGPEAGPASAAEPASTPGEPVHAATSEAPAAPALVPAP